MHIDDELDEADRLIDATLLAVCSDTPFPDGMARPVLDLFSDLGATLGQDESMLFGVRGDSAIEFNSMISERLQTRISRTEKFEDKFDVAGEIRAAALKNADGGSFRVKLDDDTMVDGVFTDQQEMDIIGALHEHNEVRIRLEGSGEYDPTGELVRILRVDDYNLFTVDENPYALGAPSILEIFDDVHKSVPENEWGKLPTDGAVNYKHYLYGWPKEGGE